MAIPIEFLQQEFRNIINRVDSGFNKVFSVVKTDLYLNRGMDTVFEKYFKLIDSDPMVKNHLRQLEKEEIPLTIIERTKNYTVGRYPADFIRLSRQGAIMKCKDCDVPRRVIVHAIASDKLDESLKDPYWEPSVEWEETLGKQADKGYYVFHKETDTVESIIISYFRKPKPVAAVNMLKCADKKYVLPDGTVVKKNQDFEVDSSYIWREVVDWATMYALKDLGQSDDAIMKMREIAATGRDRVL